VEVHADGEIEDNAALLQGERDVQSAAAPGGVRSTGPHSEGVESLGSKARHNHKLLVSICMPAYNVERFLHAALASVLAQTYQNIEVILADDASTDRTAEVARSFADERLRYIRNEARLGGFQTMNKGIGLARGDLMAVYHSDDIYEPTIVEKEVAYLHAHPKVGAVFCMDHYIDEEGRIFGGTSLPQEFQGRDWLEYSDVFPILLRHRNTLFRCPTFMTRPEVLAAVGPFDSGTYDIAADLDLWIRIVRRYPVGILNDRLMRYRVGRSQWSSRYNFLRTEPELCFRILDHYLEKDSWAGQLSNYDLKEYAFQRADDETFCAVNWVIRGDARRARELLDRPYPWSCLLNNLRRRKVRVLLMRFLICAGLAVGALRPLGQFLRRMEYRDHR